MPAAPQPPSLLVLAAGMGSRYGGLKQVEGVGPDGETLLDYSVFDALRSGFRKIVFVIRRDLEGVFREKLGRRFESQADVRYVFQELGRLPGGRIAPASREKPWGTGHAIWCAAGEVREPFAAINADDFYGADSFDRLARFLGPADPAAVPARFCMVGFSLANTLSEHGTVSRGLCQVDARGRLLSVEECTAIGRHGTAARQVLADGSVRSFTGKETVSMNCWGFSPGIFPLLERRLAAFLDADGGSPKAEFYIPSAVAGMVSEGAATVQVLPTRAAWFGVTYREDRPRVSSAIQALVRSGAYPARLWA